jgi:hypothetical protein
MSLLRFMYDKLPNNVKVKLGYFLINKKWPNVNNPKSINEKIVHRILFDRNFEYSMYADKLAVRQYIEKILGTDKLIPLVYYTDKPENIKQCTSLINKVVKPNHGAGMVKIFDYEPSIEEKAELIDQCEKWLKFDYSTAAGEWHYSNIKPYILIEEKISKTGEDLKDFKFHRFLQNDGSYIQILQLIAERSNKEYETVFYDVTNLDKPLYSPFNYSISLSDFEKSSIKEILLFNKKIYPENPYIRVDWYIVSDKIYFGEITFTPGSGKSKSLAGEFGVKMGNLWVIK